GEAVTRLTRERGVDPGDETLVGRRFAIDETEIDRDRGGAWPGDGQQREQGDCDKALGAVHALYSCSPTGRMLRQTPRRVTASCVERPGPRARGGGAGSVTVGEFSFALSLRSGANGEAGPKGGRGGCRQSR